MKWWETKSYLESDGRLTVLKPHGSIHWEHRLPGHRETVFSEAERIVVEETDVESIAPTFDVRDATPWTYQQSAIAPAIPALALPMADKTGFEWPPGQQEHLESLQGRVSCVVAIGWRAAEGHFHSLLHSAMAPDCRVCVVTPDEAEGREIGDRIQPQAPPTGERPLVINAKFRSLGGDVRWRNFLDLAPTL